MGIYPPPKLGHLRRHDVSSSHQYGCGCELMSPRPSSHERCDLICPDLPKVYDKANAAPVGSPWMWTLAFGQHEDRSPTHGYADSREAAMAAFAKSWRRE